MQTIQIHKQKLLPIIQANKIKHDNFYNAALSGYWTKAQEVLTERLTNVKNHQEIDNYLGLSTPENHADDYVRAISMIQLSENDVLQLTEQEFDAYVRNQWGWRKSFNTINSSYTFSGFAL